MGSYPTEIHQLMQPETWSSTQWASKYTDGDDSENAIFISGSCNNDKIHDMKFNLVSNNAIKDFDTTNLQIYNCDFRDSNHDCVEAGDVTGLVVHNNYMELAHDCGVRIVSGINCVVSNNTCVGTSNHENGAIYFQKTATNATVTYNIISNLYSATISGIYTTPWHADSGDFGTGTVSILHNVFYNNVGTVVSDSVNPGYGTNYTNNPNFFLPAMTVTPTPTGQTIPNNLFPIVLANWTAQGYGYQATGQSVSFTISPKNVNTPDNLKAININSGSITTSITLSLFGNVMSEISSGYSLLALCVIILGAVGIFRYLGYM